MKKLKIIFASLALTFGLAAPVLSTGAGYALFEDSKTQACRGATLDGSDCDATASNNKVSNTLASVINILSIVLGIIAVIMIIIGGIKFTTSQGDGNSTASARNTIIYAVVGLVVAALAQVLVKFVLSRV